MASCSPSNCRSVFVAKDLMQLIKDPEEKEATYPPSLNVHLTTMEELLMHVKNYILKHKLFDPTNPIRILLHENELGSLLGKSEFSIFDVRDILLEKFVYPVETKNSSGVICSISEKTCEPKKRKLDSFLDCDFSAKRIKGVDDNFTSDESIYSFQDYETEFVKDSAPSSLSDDNFSVNGLIFAERFDVDVEYEIETNTDDSDFSCESDTDIDDLVKNAIITFIARSDSDVEYLADESSDETHSEQEISEEDKWCCSSCLALNNPRMPRCEACWQTRAGWLSDDREKCDTRESKQKALARSKRKLSKKLNKNKKKDSSNYKCLDLPNVTKESLSSPSSCNDNTDGFQSSSTSIEVGKEYPKNNESDKQLCLFCCEKPADSSIIHSKFGCRLGCFKCSKRLFDTNQRCPSCRRTIERVVYLYNA